MWDAPFEGERPLERGPAVDQTIESRRYAAAL